MYYKTRLDRYIAFLISFTVLFFFTLLKTLAAGPLFTDSLTANEIIKRMEEAYANSKSYIDSGAVNVVFFRTDSTHTVVKRHPDDYD